MEKLTEFGFHVTVFTPTYNRAYMLHNLYDSLKRQTRYDFEWLIVDDGSTDNTEEVVAKWLKEKLPFPVRYYKKENGGKHRAINFALTRANGELFFIVDSDDYLSDTAIETIVHIYGTLPLNSVTKYAGIAGCKGYYNGEMIGSSFKGEFLDCLSVNREKFGISGDKAEIFITSVLREYPFPEFEGENFVTEAVVWDKMSLDGYYLRYFNDVIYLCEYLEDGLTRQGLELYYKNPQGYGYYLRQSRKAGKFEKNVQLYFDVECYLHWKNQIELQKIAEMIDTKPSTLIWQVNIYRLRKYGSKCKQFILNILKRGCKL